ncbi:type II toxin-antitoxin system YafQ family toxin [Helicobacter sp. 11S02596-1]|uniref:type II toxin-antitoxin system YafQ family toxin n=1 Tax=Helicobacter sp. 11S02596-1 TaxID=1476194 RepID=UPI000BA51E7E|nr:type II toxin-antitoxin system YafQ family toxin [Helicobacter sp. 11S02596-1]PAF42502.1 addiction module toxin RelE [Helicobacter sp. 11S02596-1]
MKYRIEFSSKFKKDYKKILKRGDGGITDSIIEKLANGEVLEPKYRDHALIGNYEGFRECHILPNLLLIYKKDNDVLVLTCVRVGSHSECF